MPPKQSQQEREADEIEEQREIEEAARTLLAFVQRTHTMIYDPIVVPQGRGRWYWQDNDVDRPRAAALEIPNPLAMVRLHEQGLAPAGVVLPRTVFIPEHILLNPAARPAGSGRWEYLTQDSHQLALVNVQGQLYFPMNYDPTAQDIFNLRQQYVAEEQHGYPVGNNLTAGIDIVWVPDLHQTGEDIEHPSTDPARTSLLPEVQQDTNSGLIHAPRNQESGRNDQTGTPGDRRWQTRIIDGQRYTVDRSTVNINQQARDTHKLWAVNKNGAWRQYDKTMDWTDEASIKDLNRWREQNFSRGEWPPKRPDPRPDYNDEERQWMWDNHVAPNQGGRPTVSLQQITRDFNQRFSTRPARNMAGITALLTRCRKEYEANDGVMPHHPGHGHRRQPGNHSEPYDREDREGDDHEEDEAAEGDER